MLDITLFRVDKGGKPELVKESQKRRFADETLVDQVIEKDTKWRQVRGSLDTLKKYVNLSSAQIGKKMKAKEDKGDESLEVPKEITDDLDAFFGGDKKEVIEKLQKLKVVQLKKLSVHINQVIQEANESLKELEDDRNKVLIKIGNIVHESCVISNNEDNNGIVRTVKGKATEDLENRLKEKPFKLLNHVDLMTRIDGMNTEAGSATAGSRGYYLMGALVRLNLALIQYAINFLSEKGFTAIYPPYFMNKTAMSEVAQLDQFDEELYKVTGEGEEKYLIATSEQPICAFHRKEWYDDKALPKKYVGYSACFRKEAGSHGRDTLGIFRVHQFEKIEQFVLTSPKESWQMMEEMITNSEAFYQSLGLSYQVVNIVSGKLNNAAAKKLDLEALFPASKTYRELVSCSNCTDYQSRRLDVRYGQSKKSQGGEKEYVHMLNSTLCATTRTMCCICENYQTEDGIVIPEVLRPLMGNQDFIPFVKKLPKKK